MQLQGQVQVNMQVYVQVQIQEQMQVQVKVQMRVQMQDLISVREPQEFAAAPRATTLVFESRTF